MFDDSFVARCARGEACAAEVADYVEAWHTVAPDVPLQDYLGMDTADYNAWLLDASVLNEVIERVTEPALVYA
jgi:hypothetical protein